MVLTFITILAGASHRTVTFVAIYERDTSCLLIAFVVEGITGI